MLMLVGDLHLDTAKPFSTILPNGINSRLFDQLEVVKKVGAKIQELKPSAVIFLGDLFEGYGASLPKIIYNAGFLTANLWSQNTELYIIVGNHDLYRGMHVFSSFESLPNVRIISQSTRVHIDNYDVDLIPWGSSLLSDKGDICAGHVPIIGAWVDADKTHQADVGIFPTDLLGYKYVFLGHFHEPQTIPVPGAIIAEYIGSIMQTDLRRAGNTFKGVVTLEDSRYERSPISSPSIYREILATEDQLEVLLARCKDSQDYYKVTITSPSLHVPKEALNHKIIYEYSLQPTTGNGYKADSEDTIEHDPTSKLQEEVKRFIEEANTVLPKDKIKEFALEALE